MSDKTFYVTTPIYYVNARPHIGHAYTTIVADVLARRHRLLGQDTFFLTGTDEHGQKIERSAAAAGIPPQQFADQVSKSFQDLWKRMGILRDTGDPLYQQDYIRTTDPRHIRGVQKLFSELYARGFIYLASYTGSYCVSDEAFVDAPVGTPCPDCGRLLEQVTEENFFFRLSSFQEQLVHLIESDQLLITPGTARNEVLSFVRGNIASVFGPGELRKSWGDNQITFEEMGREAVGLGRAKEYAPGKFLVHRALKDLSISRSSFTWGVPVPEPAASTAAQKHVIYVWLDALANYMTALGYGSDDETLFKKFWPANLHLVGKEIIRFHCVYWPAFLLALNPKLQHKSNEEPPTLPLEEHIEWAKEWLPKAITAHGWLLFEDSKMSKSKGNIVRTETILDAFGDEVYGKQFPESSKQERDLFASDVLRYFLLREIPFGQDGSFSFDALITRYNADLANGYGNLVSRTLSMVEKFCDSKFPEALNGHIFERFKNLPTMHPSVIVMGPIEAVRARRDEIYADAPTVFTWAYQNGKGLEDAFTEQFESSSFMAALELIGWAIGQIDKFITSHAPWKLVNDPDEHARPALNEVLYTAAESIRIITALLYPILPYATAKVWAQLGLGDIELAARDGELTNLQWGGLKPGTKLGPLGPIFPRADKGLAQIMTDTENPTPAHTPTSDPAAAPRTTTLAEPVSALPVGGSTALTTGPDPTLPVTAPSSAPAPSTVEATPQITIDDFAKIELRVAQILVAERIPKADKLLRLEVDLGPDFPRRQILSGIAEWYAPEDLIGRRIVVITNLAPRKMRGLESHGMLLAASHGENGKPVLATFSEDIALGSRLK